MKKTTREIGDIVRFTEEEEGIGPVDNVGEIESIDENGGAIIRSQYEPYGLHQVQEIYTEYLGHKPQ